MLGYAFHSGAAQCIFSHQLPPPPPIYNQQKGKKKQREGNLFSGAAAIAYRGRTHNRKTSALRKWIASDWQVLNGRLKSSLRYIDV